MQVLDLPSVNNKEHTIETFLISTKSNDANWKIDRETGHEKVKSFIGKDFSIIPDLLFRPLEQGGGGHVFGPRDYVKQEYAKHSHGKIIAVKGPIYDSAKDWQDYHYNAVVKLNDSRAASALLEHGNNTWVPFSVSPHIFINEEGGGNDEVGWKDWEAAALALVIKGAYGNQAVVSKLCNGPHKACSTELLQRKASVDFVYYGDNDTAKLISSLVSRTGSSNSTDNMGNDNSTNTAANIESKPSVEAATQTQVTQPEIKTVPDTQIINKETKLDSISISAEELNQLRETQKQFKKLQEQRRDEMLNSIFDIEDEEAKKSLLTKYGKYDITRVEELKAFHEDISPLISAKTKKAIEMELQAKKEEDNKKTKVNGNGRAASVITSLRDEPKVNDDSEQRAASSKTVDEVALLKKFMTSGGIV